MSDHNYESEVDRIIESTNAEAAFVFVVNGVHGHGYAHKIVGNVNSIVDMAELLENMAKQLREDAEKARIKK